MTRRILQVSHFFEDHGGGVELVAARWAKHLAGLGHEVTWAACEERPLHHLNGVDRLALPAVDPLEAATGLPMPVPMPSALASLRRAVRDHDVVLVHEALYLSNLWVRGVAAIERRPFVLAQHVADLPFASRKLRSLSLVADHLVVRPTLARSDAVVFISDRVADSYQNVRLRRPALRVFNGVDVDLFHPPEPAKARSERAQRGWQHDERVLLFVGRFVERKGLETLRRVAMSRPDWRVVVVGSGPLDPREWHLANVDVLGRVDREAVARLMGAADALVLPSVGEGFPLVIQEAMACGLPVFCGLESALADEQATAWLQGVDIEPRDPEGTALRLINRIENAPALPRRKIASYAAETYDWAAAAMKISSLLEDLLNQPYQDRFS